MGRAQLYWNNAGDAVPTDRKGDFGAFFFFKLDLRGCEQDRGLRYRARDRSRSTGRRIRIRYDTIRYDSGTEECESLATMLLCRIEPVFASRRSCTIGEVYFPLRQDQTRARG